MKKNRPAIKLSVICEKEYFDKISELLLKETTTFGVRYCEYKRKILSRKFSKINTIYGQVSVKLGYYNGELIKVTPEYENCFKIAKTNGISFTKIFQEINNVIYQEFDTKILT